MNLSMFAGSARLGVSRRRDLATDGAGLCLLAA